MEELRREHEGTKPRRTHSVSSVVGRGFASDVQGDRVTDRPAAGAACASMTEAGRMRQPTVRVRLSGGTVLTSGTTRRPAIVSEGQQNLGLHVHGLRP